MSVDIDALIEAARNRLGVGAVSISPVDREGLRIFAAEALAPSRRNATAVSAALLWMGGAIDRLLRVARLVEDRSPRLETPVVAPVFIISGARTGSTLLHHLLALEPGLRAPTLAELWGPFASETPQGRAERRRHARDLLMEWPSAAQRLHPMAPDGPDECHWILTHNPVRATFQLAETYWDWQRCLDRAALRALFESYKRQVQVFQSADPSRRWLSKTFGHAHFWPVLFDVFPDATVVRLHRDPRQSVASSCSLIQSLVPGSDPLLVGEMTIDVLADGLERMIAVDAAQPGGRFIDVSYRELCDQPVQVVTRIGERLGIGSPQSLGARVAAYLSSPRRLRAAPHAYALEDFGLSPTDVTDRLAAYLAWAANRLDFEVSEARADP